MDRAARLKARSIGADLLSGRFQVWYRYQFRQFPKVLGGCCEEELVASTAWSSQPEPVEPQYSLEMGEQHLALRSKAP